jgi:hypothetical protein
VVRPERFELPTYSSGGCRSIQLSYGRAPVFPVYMRGFSLSIGGSKLCIRLPAMIAEPLPLQGRNILTFSGLDLIAIPAAATAAVSSTPPATISAAATAGAALDLGTRFVHVQSTPTDLAAVHRRDGLLSIFGACHFDKAEAARTSGIAISHDADAVDLSVCLEKFAQFVFRSVEVEVPNKYVLHANASE